MPSNPFESYRPTPIDERPNAEQNTLISFVDNLRGSFTYALVDSPRNAIAQTANNIAGREVMTMVTPPRQAEAYTPDWFAQQIGGGVGMALPFVAAGAIGRFGQVRGVLSEAAGASISRQMLLGGAYGGLLTPVDDRGDFLSQKLFSGVSGALSFGAMDGIGRGARVLGSNRNMFTRLMGSEALTGLGSGALIGSVNADIDSYVRHGHGATNEQRIQSAVSMVLLSGSMLAGRRAFDLGAAHLERRRPASPTGVGSEPRLLVPEAPAGGVRPPVSEPATAGLPPLEPVRDPFAHVNRPVGPNDPMRLFMEGRGGPGPQREFPIPWRERPVEPAPGEGTTPPADAAGGAAAVRDPFAHVNRPVGPNDPMRLFMEGRGGPGPQREFPIPWRERPVEPAPGEPTPVAGEGATPGEGTPRAADLPGGANAGVVRDPFAHVNRPVGPNDPMRLFMDGRGGPGPQREFTINWREPAPGEGARAPGEGTVPPAEGQAPNATVAVDPFANTLRPVGPNDPARLFLEGRAGPGPQREFPIPWREAPGGAPAGEGGATGAAGGAPGAEVVGGPRPVVDPFAHTLRPVSPSDPIYRFLVHGEGGPQPGRYMPTFREPVAEPGRAPLLPGEAPSARLVGMLHETFPELRPHIERLLADGVTHRQLLPELQARLRNTPEGTRLVLDELQRMEQAEAQGQHL